jgi:hypothetical protein
MPPPTAQGPAKLLESYQEFGSLVTVSVEEYLVQWEEGNHSLEEIEQEIERLGKVRCNGQRGT